jgi:hypothetical protein
LLYPGPQPSVETGKSGKASSQVRDDRTVATHPSANGPALPRDWDEIDLNQLVLAKTEGPWANWFEAIPIEKAGDGFKLRWRDYGSLPPVIRPRFDLAQRQHRRHAGGRADDRRDSDQASHAHEGPALHNPILD